jgi:signal peptidase II
MSLLVSGGIGNMIDRTLLGYVVDFIDFRLINFAVFNGADAFVCVGAGILMLALILQIIDEEKAKKLNASISADGEKDEEAAE